MDEQSWVVLARMRRAMEAMEARVILDHAAVEGMRIEASRMVDEAAQRSERGENVVAEFQGLVELRDSLLFVRADLHKLVAHIEGVRLDFQRMARSEARSEESRS